MEYKDGIVPLWCIEKYKAIYSNSRMHIVDGENHLIIKKQKEVIWIILDFLKDTLKCGAKQTSCPDQLAKTLKLFLDNEEHSNITTPPTV